MRKDVVKPISVINIIKVMLTFVSVWLVSVALPDTFSGYVNPTGSSDEDHETFESGLFTVAVYGGFIADIDREGNLSYDSEPREFAPGDTVHLSFNTTFTDECRGPFVYFQELTLNPSIDYTVEDVHDDFKLISFIMPSSDVQASYGWFFTVTVEGGVLVNSRSNIALLDGDEWEHFSGGEIRANPPEEGYRFVYWEIISGDESLRIVDATAPTTYLLTDAWDSKDSIRAVFEPISAAITDERLYGFYGNFVLRDDETPVQITLTFTNPSIISQWVHFEIPEYEAMLIVEEDHALFMTELEALISETGVVYGTDVIINSRHQHVHNGANMTVPSNLVRAILDFESVVRIDRYRLPEIPEGVAPEIDIIMTAAPAAGTIEANSPIVTPGSEIVYTVTVRNIGTVPVNDISITEQSSRYLVPQAYAVYAHFNDEEAAHWELLDGVLFGVSSEDPDVQKFHWDIDRLEPGESFTVIIPTVVGDDIPDGTMIRNIANITRIEGMSENRRSEMMHHEVREELAQVAPELAITKRSYPESGTADFPTVVSPDSEIHYWITVTNTGDAPVRDVVVRDYFNQSLMRVSFLLMGHFDDGDAVLINNLNNRIRVDHDLTATENTDYSIQRVQWIIDNLEPGESFTMIIPTMVREDAVHGTAIGEMAGVTDGGGFEVDILSYSTYHVVSGEFDTAQISEGLTITMDANPASGTLEDAAPVLAGSGITYTVTVENTTDSTLEAISVIEHSSKFLETQNDGVIVHFGDKEAIPLSEATGEEFERVRFSLASSEMPDDNRVLQRLQWDIDSLEPGESFTVIIPTIVSEDVPIETIVNNIAQIFAIGGDGGYFRDKPLSSDWLYHEVVDESDVELPLGPEVVISMEAQEPNSVRGSAEDPVIIPTGADIVYVATVTNIGGETAKDISVVEHSSRYLETLFEEIEAHFNDDEAESILSSEFMEQNGVRFDDSTSISYSERYSDHRVIQSLSWEIESLEPGESFTVIIPAIVSEDVPDGRVIRNSVQILGINGEDLQDDPISSDNIYHEVGEVADTGTSEVEITMTPTPVSGTAEVPGEVLLDSEITLAVTIENTGEEVARNVEFTEAISGYLQGKTIMGSFGNDEAVPISELADRVYTTGASRYADDLQWTIGSYNWEIDSLEPGDSFTMVVTARVRDGVPAGTVIQNILGRKSDQAYHVVVKETLPPTIYRTSDASEFIQMGDEIEFTLRVNNPNNFYIHDFPITEELPAYLTYVEGSFGIYRRVDIDEVRRLLFADFTDALPVTSEYEDGVLRVFFLTLQPGDTYIRFRTTVNEQLGEAPPPPPDDYQYPEGEYPPDEGSEGEYPPDGDEHSPDADLESEYPPGDDQAGDYLPEDDLADQQPPDLAYPLEPPPNPPDQQPTTDPPLDLQPNIEYSLSPFGVRQGLPQAGGALVGLSVFSGSALLASGVAIAATKKRNTERQLSEVIDEDKYIGIIWRLGDD